jgi:carbamoyltransferase
LKNKLLQKNILVRELSSLSSKVNWADRLLFSEHHFSHAASAFFPSPYEEAAILTMDGVGEWTTTSLGHGTGNALRICREIIFPHSMGLLYSACTQYVGFKVNSGEYKLMGLAPYGTPRYADLIRNHLIDVKPDGSFRLNVDYFDYCVGLSMTSPKFHDLFGGPPRKPESLLTQREMDLAASIQAVLEDVIVMLAKDAARITGSRHLCLAGGVALNCVANGRLYREQIFKSIWVQPAAGDAGGAVGAALAAYHVMEGNARHVRRSDAMKGAFLGPQFTDDQISASLKAAGAKFDILSEDALLDISARTLAKGKCLGWYQGRMEFGPRALGSRSILCDPRLPGAQKTLNLKIKFRESFRPFAPSILREDLEEWFELDCDSPYMALVAAVALDKGLPVVSEDESVFGIDLLNIPRSEVPACTHVDYSARVQTVCRDTNPRYYDLITRFKRLTRCPILVNTSFNVRGEPIVCTPEDAFRCFMGTDIDALAVGNCFLKKEMQDLSLGRRYEGAFELD